MISPFSFGKEITADGKYFLYISFYVLLFGCLKARFQRQPPKEPEF